MFLLIFYGLMVYFWNIFIILYWFSIIFLFLFLIDYSIYYVFFYIRNDFWFFRFGNFFIFKNVLIWKFRIFWYTVSIFDILPTILLCKYTPYFFDFTILSNCQIEMIYFYYLQYCEVYHFFTIIYIKIYLNPLF